MGYNSRVEALKEEHAGDVTVNERVGADDIVGYVVLVDLGETADDVERDDERELASKGGRLSSPVDEELSPGHGTGE